MSLAQDQDYIYSTLHQLHDLLPAPIPPVIPAQSQQHAVPRPTSAIIRRLTVPTLCTDLPLWNDPMESQDALELEAQALRCCAAARVGLVGKPLRATQPEAFMRRA
jgi:hypothetical protein